MKYLIVLSIGAAHFINSARLTKSAQLILCAGRWINLKESARAFFFNGFPIVGGLEQLNTSAKTAKIGSQKDWGGVVKINI